MQQNKIPMEMCTFSRIVVTNLNERFWDRFFSHSVQQNFSLTLISGEFFFAENRII